MSVVVPSVVRRDEVGIAQVCTVNLKNVVYQNQPNQQVQTKMILMFFLIMKQLTKLNSLMMES